jgi:hypothetical protein
MSIAPLNQRLDQIIPETPPSVNEIDPNEPPLITSEDLDNTPPLTYEPSNTMNMEESVQVAGLFDIAGGIIRNAIKKAPQKSERTLVPDAARQAPTELPQPGKITPDVTAIPAAKPELVQKVEQAVETRKATGQVTGQPPEEAFNLSRYQTEDAAAIVGGVSDALGIKTTKVTFDEIKTKATEMGVDEKFLTRLVDANGQMMPNAVDTFRALQVLESSAGELDRLFKLVATGTATEAQKLQLRQQISFHGLVQRGVKGIQTETARALAVFRIPRDGNVDTIRNVLDEYGGDKSLTDMANAYLRLDTQAAKNAMIEKSMFSGVKDVWFTTWMNGLLSSPVTHAKNIFGNSMFGLYQIPERMIASIYSNKLPDGVRNWRALTPGSPDEKIAYDEALIMAQSLPAAMKRGFEWASRAWKQNAPTDPYSKVEMLRGTDVPPISSAAFGLQEDTLFAKGLDFYGKAITIPGRALMTEDDFFKGTLYQLELNAQASRRGHTVYRQALDEGLSEADALARAEAHVTDILTNVPSDLDQAAMDFARRGTFTAKLPEGFDRLQEVFNHPALKIIVPFFKTPTNIGLEVIERTPFAPLSSRWNNEMRKGGVHRDMAMAKVTLGSAILATFASLAAEGNISGSGPRRAADREALERTGWKPYGIKAGEQWITYSGLEPMSALLAIAADYAEYAKYEPDATKVEEVFLGAAFSIFEYIGEQPWLQGVADIGKAVARADDGKGKEAFVNGIIKQLTGFVIGGSPIGAYNSMVAGIERLIDPTKKDVKADPDLPLGVRGFYEGFNRYTNRLPYFNQALPNDLNMWGDERKEGQGKFYEMVLPTRVSPEQFSEADDILVRLGSPLSVKGFDKVDGVELTAEERNRYKQIYGKEVVSSGRDIKGAIVEMAYTPGFDTLPLDQQQENVKAVHRKYQDAAKQLLLSESPDLVARIEKLKANREAFGIYYKE